MTKRDLSSLFGMEPKEAIDFIKKKKLKPTWDYTEVWGEAHARTFTVAKVMQLDLLTDIHDSLQSAAKEGLPFKEWKERLKPTLAAKGWYGRTEVFNPDTGEFKTITVGARRLKTIYETNMRSAYNHGRYIHLQKSGMPYWMYVSALLPTTRDTHRAMHGAVYPKEHAFWSANYPPNGYNCKCKVRGYTEAMLKQRGITPRESYETIADTGFTNAPSVSSLSAVWNEKILNAPDAIRSLADHEKHASDLYDGAFAIDTQINTIMKRIKPPVSIIDTQTIEGGYDTVKERFLYWSKPVSMATVRHESGHRLDHVYGWISQKLKSAIVLEGAALTKHKEEIRIILKEHEADIQMQDLFYLSSKGKVAHVVTRDESRPMPQSLQAKEAFANFFQFYLLGDSEKIAIIKAYFPKSWRRFLYLLAKIKEQA